MKIKGNLLQICLLGAMLLLQALTIGAQPVTKVAAGVQHSLFLKSDGSVWGMGFTFSNIPKLIISSGVTAIAAGDYHSLFVKSDGSLWTMGDNYYGQLGDGTYNRPTGPEQIVASNVTAVAAGEGFSLFLKVDGSLWAMGDDYSGQLGDGNYWRGTNQPELIVSSNVASITAGGGRGMFLKKDGSLWAMGGNAYGEFGNGHNYGTNQPVLILASNVTAVAAGENHSLILKNDGSLWTMGSNLFGQLGDGSNNDTNFPEMIVPSNVTAIAAGYFHSLFIKSDGSLWAMGDNVDGELGGGIYSSPGTNRPEQIVATGVTAIAGGQVHSLFVRIDGSLWSMGGNYTGQLGDGFLAGLPNFSTNRPEQILGAFNRVASERMGDGNMLLAFTGMAGVNYALDRSFSLAPPDWIPQATNPANSFGALRFTNTPNPATNNFWRIRFVP